MNTTIKEMTTIATFAPGRINIIGEHTDYNNGYVLPAAIDKRAVFNFKKNNTASTCRIHAQNADERYEFDLNDYKPLEDGGWENYVMGVIHELQKRGAELSGFDVSFDGDVPIGAGMSSSAALECGLAYGLNTLFDLGMNKWDLIKSSQMAEHNFVGIKCGIMDQFASMMGKKNQVMLLDCRDLSFDYIPFDLGDYELLLLNTNVSHSLADSAYNTRREECETAVSIIQKKYPKVQSLRDVSSGMLVACEADLPEHVYRRSKHVVFENNRVLAAVEAMKNKDILGLGKLVYASHNSLQNDYDVSCPELDFLVDQTKEIPEVIGSRMMGGGFGGCTLNIVKKGFSQSVIDTITPLYKNKFNIELTPYFVRIGEGAGRLER